MSEKFTKDELAHIEALGKDLRSGSTLVAENPTKMLSLIDAE